ncbi:PREDICTED: uncharacterized protein LOC105972314 [Erythranthe guttata]|uniref:uncharacterized protein LOC105972314 n=1 Tax=Erythranthe guttata TaxID=4155 RepID=UPI00064DB9B3|nr:PREDICTED: uncharacterized protein LOC105972314 [Erythranthe guttata]|eukprot:XP_012852710.1 PREDICTED: uncharacterized protein LOC105972314 [Erythranthe guttata]
MQSSSAVLNTKPLLLASIHADNCNYHNKDKFYCSLVTAKFSRLQSRKPITLRPPQRGRRGGESLVTCKNTWRRFSSEFNESIVQSRLPDKCQKVSCFHSFKRKQIGLNRFSSGFFVDKSTFHLPHRLDNAKVRNRLSNSPFSVFCFSDEPIKTSISRSVSLSCSCMEIVMCGCYLLELFLLVTLAMVRFQRQLLMLDYIFKHNSMI